MSSKNAKRSLIGRSPATLLQGSKWVFGDGWAVTEESDSTITIYKIDRHGTEYSKRVPATQGRKFLDAQTIGTPDEQKAHALAMRLFLESDFK